MRHATHLPISPGRLLRFRAGLALAATVALATSASAAEPGDPLNLAAYKGRVVYLDFWASWCAPCKLSFPFMEQMARQYGPSGFVVLAVNVDHSHESAQRFLSQYGGSANIIYDSSGKIASLMKVKEMPTSILIDRKGKVRITNNGFFLGRTGTYETEIEELIHER